MNPVSIVITVLGIIEQVIPSLVSGGAASTITNIISMLEQAIPLAVQVGEDLVTPITNIIAALRATGGLTTDQLDQLDQTEAALDAAFDAAANAAQAADATVTSGGTAS